MGVTDKSGCEPDETISIVSHILESCKRLEFVGLMTIGAIDSLPTDTDDLNPDFQACVSFCTQFCLMSYNSITHTHTHTRLMALCPGLPRWAGTRKVKPIWILLEQETVSGSGIGWAICKSAPRSRQVTMPAPHHSVFYRPDALPAAQPSASKHWRRIITVDF